MSSRRSCDLREVLRNRIGAVALVASLALAACGGTSTRERPDGSTGGDQPIGDVGPGGDGVTGDGSPAACSADSDCLTGTCVNGTCMGDRSIASGGACSGNLDCVSGLCLNGICAPGGAGSQC